MDEVFDIVILGGGVAGMSAAIYAARRNKNVAIIEKFALGGQVLSLQNISNFPSQTQIDGLSLAKMFREQIESLSVKKIFDDISKVDFSNDVKVLEGRKGKYHAKSVIVASGVQPKMLSGVKEMAGVSYCAVCDGTFFRGKDVFVVSQKGSGIKAANYLSEIAKTVTVLDEADMTTYAKANKNAKIKVLSNVKIENMVGKDRFEGVTVDGKTLKGDGILIELGRQPSTKIFEGVLDLDEKGFIITDSQMKTSVKGVFAVGDVRAGELKQIVTACADGAIAGNLA